MLTLRAAPTRLLTTVSKPSNWRFRRGEKIHFEGKRWLVLKPGFRGNRADPYGPFVDIYLLRLDRKNAIEQRRDRSDVDSRARAASR